MLLLYFLRNYTVFFLYTSSTSTKYKKVASTWILMRNHLLEYYINIYTLWEKTTTTKMWVCWAEELWYREANKKKHTSCAILNIV
jgi:hypothetical protein